MHCGGMKINTKKKKHLKAKSSALREREMRESAFVKEPCSTIWVLKVYVLELWLKIKFKRTYSRLKASIPTILSFGKQFFFTGFYNKIL